MSNTLLQRSLFQIQYCAVTKRNKLLFLNCMVKDIKALMYQILKKNKKRYNAKLSFFIPAQCGDEFIFVLKNNLKSL